MTPAERARQIDKEEFEAECAAIQQRALTHILTRAQEAREQITKCLGSDIPVPALKAKPRKRAPRSKPAALRRPAIMHTAFGKSQSVDQWAQEYGIGTETLRSRLKSGWPLEDALMVKPRARMGRRPAARPAPLAMAGVSSNFRASSGTGAGSTAQETPNITFSGNEA